MAGSKFIEIDVILVGMRVLNEEKAEIKNILHLAIPLLELMAWSMALEVKQELHLEPYFDVYSKAEKCMPPDQGLRFTVLKKRDGLEAKLEYIDDLCAKQQILSIYRGQNGNRTLVCAEELSRDHVGYCRHNLLPELLAKLKDECPSAYSDEVTYYLDAAKRRP